MFNAVTALCWRHIFLAFTFFLYTSIFCLLITSCCSFSYNTQRSIYYRSRTRRSVCVHLWVQRNTYIYIFTAHAWIWSPELSRERQVVQDIYNNMLRRCFWVHTVLIYVVCIYARTAEYDRVYNIKEVSSYTFRLRKVIIQI